MNDVDSVFVWFILIAALARSKQRLTGPPGQATALTLLMPDTVVLRTRTPGGGFPPLGRTRALNLGTKLPISAD
jgi:hypothetical protein